ncbi:MAG: helix-turn-helix domain-containing protein [Gemmatimonadaceae bacterium]|jgi:hypothetical protein|nr:helix-turn-helix domain-containing protein [Gemmatimonadaceae bacterium]
MPKSTQSQTNARVAALQAPTPLPDAVPVVARHLLLTAPTHCTHDDMAELLGVNPRTLEGYVDRGCPIAERRGPVRFYHVAAVVTWAAGWAQVKADHQARRIRHMPDTLTLLDAHNRVRQREAEVFGDDGGFVLVPLTHDHPARPWALRLACAGVVPDAPLDAEEWLAGMPALPKNAPVRKRSSSTRRGGTP